MKCDTDCRYQEPTSREVTRAVARGELTRHSSRDFEQHLLLSIPSVLFILDIGAYPISSSINVLPRYTTVHPRQALNQTSKCRVSVLEWAASGAASIVDRPSTAH